jgi:hypothetical protein
MIALATSDVLRASSAYIVMAPKPMREKQTTVAPVSTAENPMPEWMNGAAVNRVPEPMPRDSWMTASAMKAAIMTTANTTRVKLTLAVEFRLHTLSPVMNATNATTQIHPGTDGNRDSMYRRMITALTSGSSR